MWARRLAFVLCLAAMALWAAALPWQRVSGPATTTSWRFTPAAVLAGTPQSVFFRARIEPSNEQLGFWMPAVQYRAPAVLRRAAQAAGEAAVSRCLSALSGCVPGGSPGFCVDEPDESRAAVPWFLLISIPVLTSFANGQDVMIVLALARRRRLSGPGRSSLAGRIVPGALHHQVSSVRVHAGGPADAPQVALRGVRRAGRRAGTRRQFRRRGLALAHAVRGVPAQSGAASDAVRSAEHLGHRRKPGSS